MGGSTVVRVHKFLSRADLQLSQPVQKHHFLGVMNTAHLTHLRGLQKWESMIGIRVHNVVALSQIHMDMDRKGTEKC